MVYFCCYAAAVVVVGKALVGVAAGDFELSEELIDFATNLAAVVVGDLPMAFYACDLKQAETNSVENSKYNLSF